jgi:hypothetical protein
MVRRSLIAMNKQAGRTRVRDPRKRSVPAVIRQQQQEDLPVEQHQPPPMPLPMQQQGGEPVGLGSMVLMGGGMALGVTLVRVVFGF